MMRRLSAVAAGLAVTLIAASAQAEAVKLKFSSFEPPQSFGPAKVYTPWIKSVDEASGGTLHIDLYAGGALGKPTAQLQIVEQGVADMSLLVPSFTPGRFEYNEIGELPFLWDDPVVAGVAVQHLIDKGLLKYPGIKVLAATMTAAYQLHTVKPVKKLEDVKGMKIRAAGPIFRNVAEAMGAVPVGIPTPSVAENISRGVLDGTMNDWTLMEAFRILDVTHNHFDFPLGGVIALLAMNQKVYDGLPAKAKAAIDKYSGDYFSKLWGNVVNAETKRIVAKVKADGKDTIVEPDAAQRKHWEATLRPVIDQWAAKSPGNKERLEAFEAELAAVKKSMK